MTAEEMWTVHT